MRHLVRLLLATLLVAGGFLVDRTGVSVTAQGPANGVLEPTPLGFAMSPERVLALEDAARFGLDYVPYEVLIRFRPGVSTAGQTRALQGLRSRPTVGMLRWAGPVAVLRDVGEPDAEILARQLRLQPEVWYAEPNYLRRTHSVPNDPTFAARQWNLTALDMPRVWDIQPAPGRNVVVAVIDTGVTVDSQSLVFRTWNGTAIQNISVPFGASPDLPAGRLLPGRDFVFLAAGQPVLDLVGHGTHVASTIAQEANNALFGVGVAYSATIMPLKACYGYWELQFARSGLGIPGYHPVSDQGGCPTDAIVAAIRYAADNGAKVINLSFGGMLPSQAERDAIDYAVGRGAFIATSMGNNFETGNQKEYPAGFALEVRGLVSVAAVGRSLIRSHYSSTGSHAEIAAPGGDTRDGGASGRIWQATLTAEDYSPASVIFPTFNRYSDQAYQGTSMASPHVAGVAALLVAQGITRPADIETRITRTARDLGGAGRDDEYGFGLISPRAALFGMGLR